MNSAPKSPMKTDEAKPGTLVHGIAASEALDTAGERISIAGMDISSLESSGVLNWEHKSDNASQIVGKILKAKKIFEESDCETPAEHYFWSRCQLPFVYLIGELFDGVGHQQAQEIAAMLKYDKVNRANGKLSQNMVNFSIEGAKLEKQGQEISRSLARKCTLTIIPANKTAIAELHEPSIEKSDERLSSIFKSEGNIEVMFKAEPKAPNLGAQATGKPNQVKGMPGSWTGHTVNHASMGSIVAFRHPEHGSVTVHKDGDQFHVKHNGAYAGLKGVKGTFSTPTEALGHAQNYIKAVHAGSVVPKTMANISSAPSNIGKSAAPGNLVNGDAVQREDLSPNMADVTKKKKISMIKAKAEEAFVAIPNRDALVKALMASRPNLTKSQAVALAKISALKDLEKKEAALAELLEPKA